MFHVNNCLPDKVVPDQTEITGQPRYLKVQGNGGNTSNPKFDISKM